MFKNMRIFVLAQMLFNPLSGVSGGFTNLYFIIILGLKTTIFGKRIEYPIDWW